MKLDAKKIIGDLVGYGLGIVGCGLTAFTFYNIRKYGGVSYYEPRRAVVNAELSLFTFATLYLGYKGLKLALGKGKERYLK